MMDELNAIKIKIESNIEKVKKTFDDAYLRAAFDGEPDDRVRDMEKPGIREMLLDSIYRIDYQRVQKNNNDDDETIKAKNRCIWLFFAVMAADCISYCERDVKLKDYTKAISSLTVAARASMAFEMYASRGKPAFELAKARHEKTRADEGNIIDHWHKYIPRNLSAAKAANMVVDAKITKLSHRKISAIISAEKKRLPSA